MFYALEMKLPVMGSLGEQHHYIVSRLKIHHCTERLVESLNLIGMYCR
jgi:hypothetical protein